MPFSPATFRFLRALARNNTREWFEANRSAYERGVAAPMRELVEEMDVRFARFAPEFIGDPKRSPFRIHQDVRFRNDKSPYKTFAAARFYHRDGGARVGIAGTGGAGLYIHLSPNESFLSAGLWAPSGPAVEAVRRRILEETRAFERTMRAPDFKTLFGALGDEMMLRRPPSGYPADHPAAPWLRYKSWTVSRELTTEELFSPSFGETLETSYAAALPLVRWLNASIGLNPATRR